MIQPYKHLKDPVMRFFLRTETKRLQYAKKHLVCTRRLYAPTKSIETAILEDLKENKQLWVKLKWHIDSNKFLDELKNKYHIPKRVYAQPADHD